MIFVTIFILVIFLVYKKLNPNNHESIMLFFVNSNERLTNSSCFYLQGTIFENNINSCLHGLPALHGFLANRKVPPPRGGNSIRKKIKISKK